VNLELKNYGEAVKYYEKSIQLDSENPRNYYVCALCYYDQEKFGKAFDIMRAGFEYAKNSPDKGYLAKYIQLFNDVARDINSEIYQVNRELANNFYEFTKKKN
jgi:tetratricopeptide (TPR) repeat protein